MPFLSSRLRRLFSRRFHLPVRRAQRQGEAAGDDADLYTNRLYRLVTALAVLAAVGLFIAGLFDLEAAEADDQSLHQTVRRQQLSARIEAQVGAERTRILRSQAARVEAEVLRALALQARASGDSGRAERLDHEAAVAEEAAERRLAGSYSAVVGAADGDTLEAPTLRRVLALDDPVVSAYDPASEARKADRLRVASHGVAIAVVGLGAAFAVLVFAQARRIEAFHTKKLTDPAATLGSPDSEWWRQVQVAAGTAIAAVVGALVWAVLLSGR
jgi:hypothetical protein